MRHERRSPDRTATMDSHYHDALVTALIETIAAWTHRDRDRLTSILCAHC
jgi:hypothetical protein